MYGGPHRPGGGEDGSVQALTDLLEAFHLPTFIPLESDGAWETVVETVGLDKKSAGEEICMIFLKRMGEAVAVRMKKRDVMERLAAIYGRP